MAGQVAYRPTEADFMRAQREAAIRRIRDPRSLRTMALVIGLVVAVKFAIDSLDRPAGEAASLAVRFGLAAVIVFALTWAADYVWSAARARSQFRREWPAGGECRFAWDEAEMAVTSDAATERRRWTDLERWAETPGNFLFWVSGRRFHFLPKRVLEDGQADDLRATVAAHRVARR